MSASCWTSPSTELHFITFPTNVSKICQCLEDAPKSSRLINVLKTYQFLENLPISPMSCGLTNFAQIQQYVICQTSIVKCRFSSFCDFLECCRQFGKLQCLPFLVEFSRVLVHVHLPIRSEHYRSTSIECLESELKIQMLRKRKRTWKMYSPMGDKQ